MENENKSLRELLTILIDLHKKNIAFMDGEEINNNIPMLSKYQDELSKISALINSFGFVGLQPIDKKLLTHPMPNEIKSLFSRI